VTQFEQLVDRVLPPQPWSDAAGEAGVSEQLERERAADAQRGAREALKTQIARLEHDVSAIVAERFPFIAAPRPLAPAGVASGPRLPDLAELERTRDHLAGMLQQTRGVAAARAEREREARALLERMKLEPGRYRFVRLPVSDLGQGGCGVWEVRPRLGLIGMLAGWWQLKLSSGCPLPRGSRSMRDPAPPHRSRAAPHRSPAAPPASGADDRSSSRPSSSRT